MGLGLRLLADAHGIRRARLQTEKRRGQPAELLGTAPAALVQCRQRRDEPARNTGTKNGPPEAGAVARAITSPVNVPSAPDAR